MTSHAVLFDLDGTLVDSLPDLTDAVNHMLTKFGRTNLQESEVRNLVGKGALNLVQRALGTCSPDEINQGLAAFTGFNAQHIADKSRLYPGMLNVLQRLHSDGARMAVISNKNESLSRLILKELEIDSYFSFIAGGDTFDEMKPSALPLIRVAEVLGCCRASTVMVGDSINDIQAGTSAGIPTIGCTWGYGCSEELSGADHLAASPDNLYDIIKRTVSSQPRKDSPS